MRDSHALQAQGPGIVVLVLPSLRLRLRFSRLVETGELAAAIYEGSILPMPGAEPLDLVQKKVRNLNRNLRGLDRLPFSSRR